MGKTSRRNQTFVIQIAISIALPPFGREALDGYIQLGARIRVTRVLGTSDNLVAHPGVFPIMVYTGRFRPKGVR